MRSTLVLALQLVTVLFGAFGGFLTRIAPPDQTHVKAIVGSLQFLVLIALLIVRATAQGTRTPAASRKWRTAGIVAAVCGLIAAGTYIPYAGRHLFETQACPDNPRIIGVLSPDAQNYMKRHSEQFPTGQPTDLPWEDWQNKFGCSELFTQASVQAVGLKLAALYAALVLTLTTAVFCLLQAVPASPRTAKHRTR